nr:immunoglobulin heavy chain junction region [Mus musculus]
CTRRDYYGSWLDYW